MSVESVQQAVDAIPPDFILAETVPINNSDVLLDTESDDPSKWRFVEEDSSIDCLGVFERIREYTAAYSPEDIHVSLVEIRYDPNNVLSISFGGAAIYLRRGLLPVTDNKSTVLYHEYLKTDFEGIMAYGAYLEKEAVKRESERLAQVEAGAVAVREYAEKLRAIRGEK